MSTRLLTGLGLAAIALGAAPGLAGASPSPPPRAELQNFACHRSSNSLNRSIYVQAVMRPVAGTERMLMKFQLFEKTPRSRMFVDVSSGDLGKWTSPTNPPTLGSRPGDTWIVQKPVINLAAPAEYRFRVSFHWVGAKERSLATVAKPSKVCEQR